MKKLLLMILIISSVSAAKWECINSTFAVCNTWRMLTPHGWIITSNLGEHGYAMSYVPDDDHVW